MLLIQIKSVGFFVVTNTRVKKLFEENVVCNGTHEDEVMINNCVFEIASKHPTLAEYVKVIVSNTIG